MCVFVCVFQNSSTFFSANFAFYIYIWYMVSVKERGGVRERERKGEVWLFSSLPSFFAGLCLLLCFSGGCLANVSSFEGAF
jgi:hypothetical protein